MADELEQQGTEVSEPSAQGENAQGAAAMSPSPKKGFWGNVDE